MRSSQVAVRILMLIMTCMVAPGLFAQSSATPGNDTDPVMVGEKVDPEIYTDFNGRRIYFSNETSKELFEMSPDEYLPNLPDPNTKPAKKEDDRPWIEVQSKIESPSAAPTAPVSFPKRIVEFFGHYHPAIVHFPVALIIAAALAELIGLRWRKFPAEPIAGFSLAIAAPGALVACASGWILAGMQEFTGAQAQLIFLHRWIGIATAVSALVCLALWQANRRRPRSGVRPFYLVAVFGTALLVTITGHLGATLVYGFETLKF